MANLAQDSLFSVQPLETFEQFNLYDLYHDVQEQRFEAAIAKTYTLIKLDIYNQIQKLKLWEIRLLLLIFTSQVDVAKREAIKLNNTLYMMDNELPNAEVYPLPKTNENIPLSLLYLLIRLKNTPSINLINELYKLTYQLRLKRTDSLQTSVYLQIISYYIVIILISTPNNNITTLNYLQSIYQQTDGVYKSNIALMIMLMEFKLAGKYDSLKLDDFTIDSLKFITHQNSIDLNNLNDVIKIDDINRFIIELASIFQLDCQFDFKLSVKDDRMSFVSNPNHFDIENSIDTDKIVDQTLDELNNNWCKHVDKVYMLK